MPNPRLKALNLRMRRTRGMHVHRTEFGAALQRGHGPAGVQQANGVEGVFESMEGRELGPNWGQIYLIGSG
jgi:hypothetical protein